MIIKFKDLKVIRSKFRKQIIVFAGGTFDLLHIGHIKYLKYLKELGDIVVIGVSTDVRVKMRKGKSRPILCQRERLAIIDAMKYVDYSLIMPKQLVHSVVPTLQIIHELTPNIFISADRRWLKYEHEIPSATKLKIVTRSYENSTTKIIRKVIKSF